MAKPLTLEQLLAEVEDVIRAIPTQRSGSPEYLSWLGRASAVMQMVPGMNGFLFEMHINGMHSDVRFHNSFLSVQTMLHQARHQLRMETVGPLSVAIAGGAPFDYFDEVRKVIEPARTDLLFVDPYLEAEFVARYLPHVAHGVVVRLLGRERMPQLVSAVGPARAQYGLAIEVRSAPNHHDRFIFVDRRTCYQSSASFKDGAKKSPTMLSQVVDTFAVVLATYEAMWNAGTVQPI